MTQAPGLPDLDTARTTLFNNIKARAYLETVAARGYPAKTAADIEYLLDLGGKMETLAETEMMKTAEAAGNPFAQASGALDDLMSRSGLGNFTKAAQLAELSYRNAAGSAMQDPANYNAVLACKAAQAEQLAAQYN